jgi:hypothetical protein
VEVLGVEVDIEPRSTTEADHDDGGKTKSTMEAPTEAPSRQRCEARRSRLRDARHKDRDRATIDDGGSEAAEVLCLDVVTTEASRLWRC